MQAADTTFRWNSDVTRGEKLRESSNRDCYSFDRGSIGRLGYAPIALQESLVHIVFTIPCAIIELSKSQHVHDLG